MDPLHLIILALATWRISSLFVNEDGPFFVFEKLRTRSGIYWHVPMPYHIESIQHSVLMEPVLIVPDRFFPQLLSCVWCFSAHAGGALVLLHFLLPTITFYAALPFALSTLAILINLVVEKLSN